MVLRTVLGATLVALLAAALSRRVYFAPLHLRGVLSYSPLQPGVASVPFIVGFGVGSVVATVRSAAGTNDAAGAAAAADQLQRDAVVPAGTGEQAQHPGAVGEHRSGRATGRQ